MYATVTQSRGWLPDPIGGVVWLGYGNPAMTTYVPIYAGVTDLPEEYKTDGHTTGYSHRSAWWAFKQVATIAAIAGATCGTTWPRSARRFRKAS